MRFLHDERVEDDEEPEEVELHSGAESELDVGRFTDLFLQTQLSEDKLQKRLLAMAREAKTLEEEQGINVLYLALGFLRWFEDEKSDLVRQAPLILVPVALKRNDLTSLYEVSFRGEDILTNEPLKHRLNDDFGIKLPEIPDDEDWDPASYFDGVQRSVSGKSRWSIDIDGIQLGFFSFAKLLMVKDLQPDNWPEERVLDHALIRGLLSDGFEHSGDDFPEGENLDTLFAPADLIQVVDADSSQTLVIESVRKGRNLVVQGPPGTGKSQTITNIIAAAAYDGKSVLFMAEKMAALNVVHDRLRKSGLSELCLELHSRQANKKLVLQELARTLNAPAATPANSNGVEELTQLRDKLNAVASVMHKLIGATGTTPYRVISTLVRLQEAGFSPPDISIRDIQNWPYERRNIAIDAVDALARITQKAGRREEHPFNGVHNPHVLPTDLPRLKQRLDRLLQKIDRASEATAKVARSVHVDEEIDDALTRQLSQVLSHISQLSINGQPFAAAIAKHGGIDAARGLAEIGTRYGEKARASGDAFVDAAIEMPISHLRQPLATGLTFLGRLRGPYRRASAELQSLIRIGMPGRAEERIALVDKLFDLQKAVNDLRSNDAVGAELLGSLWQNERTDFAELAAAADWLQQLTQLATQVQPFVAIRLRRYEPEKLKQLGDHLSRLSEELRSEANTILESLKLDICEAFGRDKLEDVPFDVLGTRFRLWNENLDRLDEWSRLIEGDEALRQLGCDELADRISSGAIAPEQAVDTLRYTHCEALYRVFASAEPWITRLTCDDKAKLVTAFVEREKSRFKGTARLIRGEHLGKLPRGGMGAMGIIRGEIGKRRAHKPIRKLMTEAGTAIQQIKPVFLMSPISIAQYLPPGRLEFDVLVIDEASQVRPEDALGAVARAKQIVVVGDTKQLPPTSFFDRMVTDGSDDEPDDESELNAPRAASAADLESVLTLCEARGLSSKMLKWHYRSKHPSLIEVSNAEFYDGDLILFPSPAANREADGLVVTRIAGAYDRGGKRTNRIEAQAIVSAVAKHARNAPGRSLGVVTFSTAQRDLITELLELTRREDEELDAFIQEGRHEEFFVKNLENVQGDERDVIFVSVGYGPRVAGQRLDSMAFGPVSTEGGERRLNVLFTRARFRTQVFVSFDSGDINLDRTKSMGARVLKRFLAYAETGIAEQPQPLGEDPDSEFECAVAKVIRRLGYEVDHQVGSGGFKIDLAVRDPESPGHYMLAIECDGATYHSALWARERDRLRQEILEGLGWRFHRIWSTDWFHRRQEEVRRLEEALLSSRRGREEIKQTRIDLEADDIDEDLDNVDVIETPSPRILLPAYHVANFPIPYGTEPHEVPTSRMAEIVGKIIDVEGPVHQEEIARRVGNLFGKQKAGSRIARSVLSALRLLHSRDQNYRGIDGFWMTNSQQEDPPLRDRSAASLTLRKADMIPPMEMEEAILRVVRENGAVPREEIPRAVALLFGFQRTGPDFSATVFPVIDQLADCGKVEEGEGGMAIR
jgi:very-short-patch-repair endonuclease